MRLIPVLDSFKLVHTKQEKTRLQYEGWITIREGIRNGKEEYLMACIVKKQQGVQVEPLIEKERKYKKLQTL